MPRAASNRSSSNHRAALSAATALALLIAIACRDGGGRATPTEPAAPSPTPPALPEAARATLYGADDGDSAGAIAAGDFNGDDAPDVVLTASAADGPRNSRPDAGEAYVFLGPLAPGQERDALSGDYDLIIYGAEPGDQLGRALAVGDFDGDGIDDIALGAPFADGPQADRPDAGQVDVFFGSKELGTDTPEIDLAQDFAGATVFGGDAGDLAGFTVSAADTDGDSVSDLIVGAFWADGPENQSPNAGEVYVINGLSAGARIDAEMGDQDTTVYGAEAEDRLGEAMDAGDVNGDGLADLILAAPFADGPNNERDAAGEVYVILSPPPTSMNVADGQQAVTILGIDPGDQIGHSIASADANGDGFGDVFLGAVSADGPGNLADLAGEAYLFLGGGNLSGTRDAAAGDAEAIIYGAAGERLGRSAAAGDVNGDGLADLLMAAPVAAEKAGAVYVFLGRGRGAYPDGSAGADAFSGGVDAMDVLGYEVFGVPALATADMNGDGLSDVLVVAPGGDGPGNSRDDCGEAYVIFAEADR